MAKRMPLFIAGQEEVPWMLRGWVAGAFGHGAIDVTEIGHIYGGRAAKPAKPILVYGPNSRVLTVVVGGGEAEAAELEELAEAAIEKQVKRNRDDHLAQIREDHGLPRREQVPALISQALRDHGRDKIRNPSKYPVKPKPDRSWIKKLPEIPVE